MYVNEIRLQNLMLLIEQVGTIAAVANRANASAAYLSQIINKVPSASGTPRSIGNSLARKIEEGFNLEKGWMDYSHNFVEAKLSDGIEIDLENNPDYPAIKHVNLKLSAGISGYAIEQNEEEKVPLVFSKDWFYFNGYLPHQLIAVKVSGESMQPVLHDGDTVIINTGDNAPKDSCVYAINYEGELLIKRMVRDQGNWWLSSDNPDQSKYPRKRCDGDYCIVIGRIVHRQSEKI